MYRWRPFLANLAQLTNICIRLCREGFGGLAAALTGYGLYLDPTNTFLVRRGDLVAEQTVSADCSSIYSAFRTGPVSFGRHLLVASTSPIYSTRIPCSGYKL
jgi:hypothetical protein